MVEKYEKFMRMQVDPYALFHLSFPLFPLGLPIATTTPLPGAG